MIEKFDIPADAAARMKMLKELSDKSSRIESDRDADEPSPTAGQRKRPANSDEVISSESKRPA